MRFPEAKRLCLMHRPETSNHSSGLKFTESRGITDWLYSIYLLFKLLTTCELADKKGKQIWIEQDG